MSQARTTELLESKVLMPADQESTNTYVDVTGSEIDAYSQSLVSYTVKNTDGANSIDYKVLASIDGITYVEVQAEASLASGATGTYATTTAAYRYYKVQIKATVVDSQGDAQVRVIAKH